MTDGPMEKTHPEVETTHANHTLDMWQTTWSVIGCPNCNKMWAPSYQGL